MSSPGISERPASFEELDERRVVAPGDLLASLAAYALNGWAISGDVVVGAARRANLTPQGLQALSSLSQSGIEQQMSGGRFDLSEVTRNREALQYAMVAEYAQFELIMIARSN